MKPIKSVALMALSLAALTACDRRGQNDNINPGSSTEIQREEVSPAELDRNAAEAKDGSSAVGSGAVGAGDEISDDVGTQAGTGAALDDQLSDEEWKDGEMGEEDLNIQEEEYTGDNSDSIPQESGNVKYLDNTSSEPDLRRQDKGIPIGREPGFIDNTSSEGNPNQM